MTVTRSNISKRAEVGLAPPDSPIPGGIAYEQIPLYAQSSGGWWWWGSRAVGGLSVVFACIRLISQQIGSLPASVFRNAQAIPDQPGWLKNPAPTVYGYFGEAVETAVVSLLLRGNAYLISTGEGSNTYPLGWVVANPDEVVVERRNGRLVYRWGPDTALSEDEVCHLKYVPIPGSLYGASPLDGAANELRSAMALASYASDLAVNGAMPYGVLRTEQRLKPGQAVALSEQYQSTGGTRRGVLVLDSGLSYSQLQLSPREMALLELREFDARAICSTFGVPPWLVNVPMADGLTYSTVEGQKDSLLSFTLDPILRKLEGVISYRFLPGDRMLRFDRDRFTLPNFAQRMTSYRDAVESGVYTVEELRAFENLPPGPAPGALTGVTP